MSNPQFSFGPGSNFEVIGLRQTKYPSNQSLAVIAILKITEEGEPDGREEMTVSINFDHDDNGHASSNLQPGEFIAKNYSEGEKLCNALMAAGWLYPTGEVRESGYVTCPICKLTKKGSISCLPQKYEP